MFLCVVELKLGYSSYNQTKKIGKKRHHEELGFLMTPNPNSQRQELVLMAMKNPMCDRM
jgi:hypothetical protein